MRMRGRWVRAVAWHTAVVPAMKPGKRYGESMRRAASQRPMPRRCAGAQSLALASIDALMK